jgi:thiol:disulfide interchange protein DsbD
MAGAVGAALTMPTWQALLVFEAIGFGLALPFLLISLLPFLRRFLPKPGAWMETFKQLMAFPMYASVIWLMWVLTMEAGPDSVILTLTGMLAIVIAIWIRRLFADGSSAYRLCAIVLYILVFAGSLSMLNRMEIATAALPEAHAEHNVNTVDYSKEKLAALRKEGKPVFVDATAAWCITCQINARVALHTNRVMQEFKKRGITLMIADWTRRNDAITEFLSGFGYKGVPLCVFYPENDGQNKKEPVVLPQILTEDIVLKTINGK